MKPMFIVLEGIDGAGTTSQAKHLAGRWRRSAFGRAPDPTVIPGLGINFHKCLYTCEPTDGPIGKMIRCALRGEINLTSSAMALLFAADRQQHMQQIREILDAGLLSVICDRYAPSSWVYQGMDLPLSWVEQINADLLIPDLLLFLDCDPDVAAKRRAERPGAPEIFDDLDIQRTLAARYRTLVPTWPGKFAVIDAMAPFHDVAREIAKAIEAATSDSPSD